MNSKKTILSRDFVEAVKAHNRSQELLEAIRAQGDSVEALEAAVAKGADLNREIADLNSENLVKLPLQWTIHFGKFERFKKLLSLEPKVGAKANLQAVIEVGENKIKMSMLHYAAAKGLTKFVTFMLLEKGMDATLSDQHERGLLPIHHAATSGNRETLDALNKNKEALNAVSAKGDFCVHVAAMLGNSKMLEYLFQLGADPRCRNSEHRTPLHCAVRNRRKDAVCYLSKIEGLRDDVDFQGRNALLVAVEAGSVEMVTILAPPGNKFTDTDYNGFGAMHIAVQNNNVAMMRFLKSTDILTFVATDDIGRVHVHIAAEYDALKAFNFVVDELHRELSDTHSKHSKSQDLEQAVVIELRQILVNWQDKNGDSVVEYAFRFRAKKIINRLIELGIKLDKTNIAGNSLMHQMVERTDEEMVIFLLGKGVSWTQKNSGGITPVQMAFINGNTIMLDVFRTKTDYNFMGKDEDGVMLIHLACIIGQKKSLEWLLQHNFGSLNVLDNRGCNCLFNAARGDQAELIVYLVKEKKMSLDGFCARKLTVMHHAIFKSAKNAAIALNKLGVSFEARGEHGILPLHLACRSGLPGMVDFLIQQGVNKDACNDFGRNAWVYAASGCFDLEMFNTLERHQIPLAGVLDRSGMSPLHHAAMAGNLIAVKYFLTKNLDRAAPDNSGLTPVQKAKSCHDECQRELKEKMKIPEYSNGKNQKLNEEIERLKRRIEGCFDVEYYLKNLELKRHKKVEEKSKVVDKRERKEKSDGDEGVRIVKPRKSNAQPHVNDASEVNREQPRPPF